ncbi:TPA: conjugative transfer relaxase/helicase TraI [Legionella pneumophila]|nr:conjugative transfer relaxase/helicase TraI [Legionella pneumophila]HCU5995174.1 conjugative transfer relaxase/helicase TraI [Legionella pneumophila]
MLSIQPLKSAEGSTNYYLNVVNYYGTDSKSIRWLGEGSKALGLLGKPVEAQQMLALLQGTLPDGTQLGRIDKEGIHHRPGFDMTLSAPKSFSILLESGADPRLAEALDKAVEWFVTEMEQEFAQARVMVDGVIDFVDTKNFVIAAFRQPNSRANDPQSHVHLVVMNMTKDRDKWRSLASDMRAERGVVEQIMKNHIYGGLKFRNKLANLTKELGYALETTGDGLWEIKGVPKEVLKFFSKRREDIEQYMDEHGLQGAKAASHATQRTKMDKEIVDFEAWKGDILKSCQSHGFDALNFVTKIKEPKTLFEKIKESVVNQFFGKERLQVIKGQEAVRIAIESVSQNHTVFSPQKIKEHALKHLIASDSVVDERYIDKALAQNIQEQKLYQATHPLTQKPVLTTPWQLQLESETIARIERGKNSIRPIAPTHQVAAFIKQKEEALNFSLSASQKKAMHGFLTTSDRFMAIQGYAGTGKTTMLKLTRELAEIQGYQLRGVTAGSSAASELQTKGGLSAATFARELLRLQKNKEDLSKIIFVVDEASMLSNPQGHKIIELVDEAGSQIKIIGDRAQLPSPSSGRWFGLIQDYGIDTVSMTDNLRQKEGLLKEAAIHASRGEIHDAVEKLTDVKVFESYNERINAVASSWLELSLAEREKTLCFAPTHKNRKDITEQIRARLKEEGGLTGDAIEQEVLVSRPLTSIELRQSVYYEKGEILRFNTAIKRYNINAGDYLTVLNLDTKSRQKNTLRLLRDNGRCVNLPLSALPKFNPNEKDLERPVEVYRVGQIELQAGDIIQWKRNDAKKGLHNSDLAKIQSISSDKVVITHRNNETLVLHRSDKALSHLDHGYVLTTYGAQGKDKKRGIGLIESMNRFAATIENFYVEITRAVEDMTVITDDKKHLVQAITTQDAERGVALDAIKSTSLQQHAITHAKDHLSLREVIEKKQQREEVWDAMGQDIVRYNEARQLGHKALAGQLAFKIVNDPTHYRLAQVRLAQGIASFRKDALNMQTAKYLKHLPEEERTHFNLVRRYVTLSQDCSRKAQQQKAHADIKNDKISNQQHLRQEYNKLHELAFKIANDIEKHKPWLKHFSIGEVNRLGLPQHLIGEEEKKAYNKLLRLADHAQRHRVRQKVQDYIELPQEQKPALAQQIKRDAALAHRYILDIARQEGQAPEELWKAIHNDARRQSDQLFRNALSIEGKKAFDIAASLREVRTELGKKWAQQLQEASQESPQKPDPKTQELIALKNKLASDLIQSPGLNDIASYFKINSETLKKQSTAHYYRENVAQFLSANSHFKARLDAARAIRENVKGHYPFIMEAHIDTHRLGKYLRITERQERSCELQGAALEGYKEVLAYKMAHHQAKTSWRSYFALSESERQSHRAHSTKASQLTAIRDARAHALRQSMNAQPHLDTERIQQETLNKQADTHVQKCEHVVALNQLAEKLMNQYPTLFESPKKDAQIRAWKENWLGLTKEMHRAQQHPGYSEAIKGHESMFLRIQGFDKTLREQYGLPTDHEPLKSSSPALQRIKNEMPMLDARQINEVLMLRPEETYKAIFGEPKSMSAKEMRYSGGLIITLKGSKQGCWYDFSEGRGGLPIDAIMASSHLDFKDALKQAASMAGLSASHIQPMPIQRPSAKRLEVDEQQLIKNKHLSAQSIWNGSIPIAGTLAETYLKKHRGIEETKQLEVRFWPKGARWLNDDGEGKLQEQINKTPALIIPAHSANQKLTGVQRIYLDEATGGKNRFMDKPKLSKGVLESSAALIQTGMKGAPVYLCEGPETAASIAQAFPTANVIASLGVGNMKNLGEFLQKLQPSEVIIAADHDGAQSKTMNITHISANALKEQGINVRIVMPEPIPTLKKTDWNDVLIHEGKASIYKQCAGVSLPETNRLYGIDTIKAPDATLAKSAEHNALEVHQKTTSPTVQKQKEMEMEL